MLTVYGHIYLIDFGIARHFKPDRQKTQPRLADRYAALNNMARRRPRPVQISTRWEQLHQSLSGNDPADTPFNLVPAITWSSYPFPSREIDYAMIQMDTSKRPTSIAAIKQELQSIATQQLIVDKSPASWTPHGYQPPAKPPIPGVRLHPGRNHQKTTRYICSGHQPRHGGGMVT
jgi:serine/threonine protein kinase